MKACRPRSMVLPYQMGLAIQLDHKFGSKLHWLGYTESYADTQNYKYCFLNNRNGGNTSDVLDTITEDTNDEIDDEIEVDIELTFGEVASEGHNDM